MLKRFISILLTVVMVSTLWGGMNFGQNVEVKAATAGITNGATYTIVSAYNGKAITTFQHFMQIVWFGTQMQ